MMLTPRQLAAYLEFSERLDRIDRANSIVTTFVGAQADKKGVEKTVKELAV